MAHEQSQSWIADGEKYALLGLSIKVTGPAIGQLDLSPHFQVVGGNDFKSPDEWCEWLGSIRVEEVEACDVFIAAKLSAALCGRFEKMIAARRPMSAGGLGCVKTRRCSIAIEEIIRSRPL
jgi:hypothetical protein